MLPDESILDLDAAWAPGGILDASFMGGPGLRGYAYRADVYCQRCAESIAEEIVTEGEAPSSEDSPRFKDGDLWPQPVFFPEADVAQECALCGEYLYGGSGD